MTRTNRTISSVGGGVPDWDSSKSSAIDISTPYTMTRDGVLNVRVGFGPDGKRGEFELFINGAAVWLYASWDQVDASGNACLVRVSTGDVISCKITHGIDGYSVTYFPLKS